MLKIAFLDVDMTLVDNNTSEYNKGLIDFLLEHEIQQVYLVTGRNPNDLWQHVFHMGTKPPNWRRQLLFNVVKHLESNGLIVRGVSTPYDHYLKETSQMFNIEKAGDAAIKFYIPFEQLIGRSRDDEVDDFFINKNFSQITYGNCYVGFPGEEANASLIEALPIYLACTNDTEKRGQLSFLLERLLAEYSESLDIYYFDDKSENLAVGESLFASHSSISTFHTILVDKINEYTVPLTVELRDSYSQLKF